MKRSGYIKRKTPLKRSTKPIARVGKVYKRRKKGKDLAKSDYFEKFGWTIDGKRIAPCQACGEAMLQGNPFVDPHHKKKASQGGDEQKQNLVIVHRSCHDFFHGTRHIFVFVKESPANSENGLQIFDQKPEIKEFLREKLRSLSQHYRF